VRSRTTDACHWLIELRASGRQCGVPRPANAARRARRRSRVPTARATRSRRPTEELEATDVLACPCGGRHCVVAVVVDSAIACTVLAALGLPSATFAPVAGPVTGQALDWFATP